MPKMKTHSATKKRFRVTGSGKITRRHAFTSHLLEKKTAKRKRHARAQDVVAAGDRRNIKRLLGLR
jgi:large subunit ribosomal protein L35